MEKNARIRVELVQVKEDERVEGERREEKRMKERRVEEVKKNESGEFFAFIINKLNESRRKAWRLRGEQGDRPVMNSDGTDEPIQVSGQKNKKSIIIFIYLEISTAREQEQEYYNLPNAPLLTGSDVQ